MGLVTHGCISSVVFLSSILFILLTFHTQIAQKLLVGNHPVRLKRQPHLPLCFRHDGTFKILQVADMHYGTGAVTHCRDVLPSQLQHCSDLNTTSFLRRIIQAEKPDFVAFTGDNIFGISTSDAAESLLDAFDPVIKSELPWAAVLGNHDHESSMDREELMSFLSLMDYSVSQVNPSLEEDTSGAPRGCTMKVDHGCRTSSIGIPALAFFHVPIPEMRQLYNQEITGQLQEAIACSSVDSGVLKTFVSMGDVKAVFMGHDHANDFCGKLEGVWLCYGGGFGYHAYGRAGWARRARIVVAELGKGETSWRGVERIRTWKRLDDEELSKHDEQILWELQQ